MLFYYKRIEDLDKGKAKETEFEDCFNIHDILRGSWMNEDYFIVTLRDGHEESKFITKPEFNKNGKLVGGEKARVYDNTNLALNKRDATRLRMIAGLVVELEDAIIPTGDNLKPWSDNPTEKAVTENETQGPFEVGDPKAIQEPESVNY